MKHIIFALVGFGISLAQVLPARADHKDLNLFVAPALETSGLTRFLLPRFSLKTGVKIHVISLPKVIHGGLSLQTGLGAPVFSGQGVTYAISTPEVGDTAAIRFHDWLLSDIGQRTITQFAPDGVQLFTGAAGTVQSVKSAAMTGNVQRGETLSYANCGRCHVIGHENRMNGIGSTPSFPLLRGFDDWETRFRSFYALNPHPSFTQIKDVTDPFSESLPSPISPLFLTQQELDDIVTFTQGIKPVDLGAPLVHQ